MDSTSEQSRSSTGPFFTAANFLSYGNKLYVVRAANTTSTSNGALNALANTGAVANALPFVVKNEEHYITKIDNSDFAVDTDVKFIAKYPGSLGNSLKISVCDSANAYSRTLQVAANTTTISSNVSLSSFSIAVGSNTATVKLANTASGTLGDANTAANTIYNSLYVGDFVEVGNSSIGKQYLKITSLSTPTTNSTHAYITISFDNIYGLHADYAANTVTRYWEFFNSVDKAPGQTEYQGSFGNTAAQDELHVVVVDQDGQITGTPDTVLEVYQGLSRATDAKTNDGAGNFYEEVINQNSNYVWTATKLSSITTGAAVGLESSSSSVPTSISFVGGQDGDTEYDVPVSALANAYDLFRSAEDIDISLILAGKARGGTNGE